MTERMLAMQANTWLAVRGAREYGTERHGPVPGDNERCLLILVREVGEVAGAIRELTKTQEGANLPDGMLAMDTRNLYNELAQVASFATLWMERLRP